MTNTGELIDSCVLAEKTPELLELYDKGRYGEPQDKDHMMYASIEALYLVEKEKLTVYSKKKELSFDGVIKSVKKIEPNLWTRYCVYKDLRKRGYIVKTALKFGADFRVYERGIKPGDDHAKWVVFPVAEGETLTWYEFAAKNRVAHSTRKKLLLAIVDAEGEPTYYVCSWLRP